MTWEYRCVKFPTPSDFRLDISFKTQYEDLPGKHTELLNELGADGWEWFHTSGDLFYFRREVGKLTDSQLRELALKVASTWLQSEDVERVFAETIKAQGK